MKHGCKLFRLVLCAAVTFLFVVLTVPGFAGWTEIDIPGYSEPLDTIWGTSDTNIYIIGFTGHVFHKVGDEIRDISTEVFGNKSVLLTTDTANAIDDFPKTCIPFGLGGTGPDNVYIAGMILDTDLIRNSTDSTASSSLYQGTPFLMRYDGHIWTNIPLSDNDVDSRYLPHSLVGICGTGPDNMYFSGWKVVEGDFGYINTGVILHLNALTGKWTGEVGVGDLVDDPDSSALPEINEITFAGDNDIYAAGLRGLILHKSLYTGNWEVMNTRSSSLYFFRIWAYNKDHVYAAGFSNSDYKAAIYRLNGDTWTSMAIPRPKQGQIPVLWGLWGGLTDPEDPQSELQVFAVGNAGSTLYYDGNSGNEWYSMLNATTTSLNGLWGAATDSVYACGEDGNLYHYDGVLVTDDVKAYPMLSVAPATIEFTDMSPADGSKWDWDFGDSVSEEQAPTADLDYKIAITAVKDVSLNGKRIAVLNDDNITSPYLQTVDAVSAQVNLGGKLLVTAVPGREANDIVISIQKILETDPTPSPVIHYYDSKIIAKVTPDMTQEEVAALLESEESLEDIIESAVPDSPTSLWDDAVIQGTLEDGKAETLYVYIDSGNTTYQEIADLLVTHPWISSAEADTPDNVWIRGYESVSNVVYLSGGLDDTNTYTNTDTSISYYYMARHTYSEPGDYEVFLNVTHPEKPAKGTIIINKDEIPVDYAQTMTIEAIPGITMNGLTVTIADGGDGVTPYTTWTEVADAETGQSKRFLTAHIDSGTTLQSEVADLLLSSHAILITSATYPGYPWYVSETAEANSVILYGGSRETKKESSVTVKVLEDNPIDFTISPAEGVGELNATFKAVPSDIIKGNINTWTWYFDYVGSSDYGSEDEGTIYDTDDEYDVITHHYEALGTYHVMLKVVLDDNSPFYVLKTNAVSVNSPDEDKSSLEGGSGLGDVDLSSSLRGCFISVMDD